MCFHSITIIVLSLPSEAHSIALDLFYKMTLLIGLIIVATVAINVSNAATIREVVPGNLETKVNCKGNTANSEDTSSGKPCDFNLIDGELDGGSDMEAPANSTSGQQPVKENANGDNKLSFTCVSDCDSLPWNFFLFSWLG